MPALARLLRAGALGLHSIPSGLPTSTPAFQAGLMYGGPVDVPGLRVPRQAEWDLPVVPAPLGRRRRGGGPRSTGGGHSPRGPHLRLRVRGRRRRHGPHLRPSSPAPRLLGASGRSGASGALSRGGVAGREDVGGHPLGAPGLGGPGAPELQPGTPRGVVPSDGDAPPRRRLAPRAPHARRDRRPLRGGAGPLRELRGLRRGRPRARAAPPGGLPRPPGYRPEHRTPRPGRPPGEGARLRPLRAVRPWSDPLGAVPRCDEGHVGGRSDSRLLRARGRGRTGRPAHVSDPGSGHDGSQTALWPFSGWWQRNLASSSVRCRRGMPCGTGTSASSRRVPTSTST